MPCGTFTTSKIPNGQQDAVGADFQLDNPTTVSKTQATDGTWTVTAVFPPCPPNTHVATDQNVHNLATIIMSEASIGNTPERQSVAFCALNRMTGSVTQVSELWR